MLDSRPTIERLPDISLSRGRRPLYQQLLDILRDAIVSGQYGVGEELPKESQIAERFGISLITVRQALRDLESEGLISKRSAKLAVVVARDPSVNLSWNFKNFADIEAATRDARLRIKSYRKEAAPAMQRHFGMAGNEKGYCLRSVLSVGEQKRSQITTYFPPDIGARLQRKDFTDVLIFRSVQQRLDLRMAVAHVTVRASVANPGIATDLDIETGSAVLDIEMLYQTADGRHVEFSIARHPADLFSITYDAPNDLI